MNRTELALMHTLIFGLDPSVNVSRKELMDAIENDIPVTDDWPDQLREMTFAVVDHYWDQVSPQLGCSMWCDQCPVGKVAACIQKSAESYPVEVREALEHFEIEIPEFLKVKSTGGDE